MKIYFSDSLISEALILLQAIKQNNCCSLSQIESIKTYYGINKEAALCLIIQCKWINKVDNHSFEITQFGEKLLSAFKDMQINKDLYRVILYNYITVCKPIWARRIPFGRNEAYRIMSDEEQVCFLKAGLMDEPVSQDVVEWWDSLAELERIEVQKIKEEIGRAGEVLTIDFEKERTKTTPTWESINSNLIGFDILSQASEYDSSQILIEVKASKQKIDSASFFITLNEWKIASANYNQNRYFFYLWLLEASPQIAIIPCSEMKKHIPTNNGQGEWVETNIPFIAFKDAFFKPNSFQA